MYHPYVLGYDILLTECLADFGLLETPNTSETSDSSSSIPSCTLSAVNCARPTTHPDSSSSRR